MTQPIRMWPSFSALAARSSSSAATAICVPAYSFRSVSTTSSLSGHIAENLVHLRAEGGGIFHAFSKLQHQGTRGAASDVLDATPD
uniref:Secreted protein n=1 Tax=Trichogramma kaykai TaxID=54128 RepID=A0ABD2X6T2_9HYME